MLRLVKNTIKQIVLISFFIFISSSNSFASNTTPIEFSITSSTAGYDAYGIGCEISTVRSTPTITIPEIVANTQHVYVTDIAYSNDGSQVTIAVAYNADDNVTGLGLAVHFDSSQMTFNDASNVLALNLFIPPYLASEGDDGYADDGNEATNAYVNMSWASFTGASWPGNGSADLLSLTFDIAENATGSSAINFTRTHSMAGWGFEGQTHELNFGSQAPNSSDDCDAPTNLNNEQAVYIANSTTIGSQKLVTIGYASSDPNLVGLGINVHYDSNALTLSEITDVLQTNIFITPVVANVEADVDNEDGNADTDMLINMMWVSFIGNYWPGSTPANLLTMTFDIIENDTPIQPKQLISVANTPRGIMGKTSVLEVAYDTTNNNNQLSGLGMRVHFDSNLLSFKGTTDIIEQDIIVNGEGPFNDSADLDNDPLTDKYISFGWASLFNNWPDTNLPTILMNMAFDVSDSFGIDSISSTNINFTDSAFTSGYEFSAETYSMEILKATWDFDENGQADALSDGLMMIRYLFGLRGSAVTNSTVSSDSSLSSEEIVANIEAAMNIADIDADDKHNALTDGLLLMRYLFGLRDNSLTQNVVSPEAARFAAEEVEEYIERFMPVVNSSDSDSSGSDSSGSDSSGVSGGDFDLSNATEVGPIAFENQFGGAFIAGDGSYSVPTGSEVWAGFSVIPANAMIDVTPFTFGSGGKLTFKASVAGNANADVRFRFEKALANGDDVTPTVPSYTTESKTLSGVTETEYTVTILPQGSRTYGSLMLYIDTKDVAVYITDVMVSTTPATAGEEIGPFAFTQVFGGSTIPADDTFISTGTDPGGFAVVGADTGIDTNPLYFGNGGYISFIGSVNGGGSVGVKFEVHADVYPYVQPNYVADVVTVSGPTPKNYSVSIPGQYDNGFKNVVVYLEDLDTEVVMKEIMIGVTEKGDPKAATVAPAEFRYGAFEGAAYDEETSTFSFPSSAKSYAGFANNNTDLYPMTFDNGGCVTFNASAETDVRIRYKFERQPYPGNLPEMFTEWVTISGTEQEYTVDIPASASAGNTYSSFLLFIDPDYKDLPVGVNTVIATNTGACGS